MPAQGGGGNGNKGPLIILVVLLVAAVVGGAAFFLLSGDDDSSPEDVVTDYIAAATRGDCEEAARHLVPGLRGNDGCQPAEDPAEINSISTTHEEGDSAEVDVTFTTEAQGELDASISLTRTDGDWLISDFGFDLDMGTDTGQDGDETALPEPPSELPDLEMPEPGDSPAEGAPSAPDSGSGGPPSGGGAAAAGPATPPPANGGSQDCFDSAQANCEQWAQECFDGNFASCDELYWNTAIGSPYEEYGYTCGGRSTERLSGMCELTFLP